MDQGAIGMSSFRLRRLGTSIDRARLSHQPGSVLAIGVSLDKPEDDPERHIAVINDQGREIGTVPVYSAPSYKNPAK
jgi:hypothetical protein